MIIVKTPMRVSLFGGGTDYPAHFKQHGGAVLGMAIDKYVWTTLRLLPPFFDHRHRVVYSKVELVKHAMELEHPAAKAILLAAKADAAGIGVELHHDADLPARSGMGSSSAFVVGLLHACGSINGRMTTKAVLADEAIRIEQQVLGENVGCQDQIFAAHGGLLRIDFRKTGGYSASPRLISAKRAAELTNSMMLYFAGFPRLASDVAKEQIDRTDENYSLLSRLREMVDEAEAMLLGDAPMSAIGNLLYHSWDVKRRLSTKIAPPEVEEMFDRGMRAGAWGGKLLGAGGGGFMMFMVPDGYKQSLHNAMQGRIRIPVQLDTEGSRVVLYQPERM